MIYRPYGKTGFSSSLFGMGCMRLPRVPGTEQIDTQQAVEMIRYAIDHGVNYLDTAYTYAGSEETVGRALQDGYRARVKSATKVPAREVQSHEDVRRIVHEQMQRLGVDFIDFYLIHRIEHTTWPYIKEIDMVGALDELKREGLIGGVGFSYHDDYSVFEEILNFYDWDMCQVQQNFLDVDKEVTEKGIRLAGQKGVALVIMEPLRGGALVNLPKEAKAVFAAHGEQRTPVDWAFRHLYNYPEISCILSGVSSMEQLKENLTYFEDPSDVTPNCLSEADVQMLREVKAILEKKTLIGCTGCFYCMPCPSGVKIPNVFSLYNDASIFDDVQASRFGYSMQKRFGGAADLCTACGACERVCPQHLPIIETLQKVEQMLG